ncbi:PBSX family phage terminase large subunit [Oculatella sp. LEGE 06141]|uniref:PBSX family phage terminase large subunit n=1 Tax=Oculatella sp. LEGE 06141 TaxID=1828648 RepID=UPI0018827784|nr:PBSX family phage terminase large subunit [Oculatella sp. LEGE 06141]MBE9178614.1 PBSX family phage terminase large subunit [Oculatella sp. LEGE 06141]
MAGASVKKRRAEFAAEAAAAIGLDLDETAGDRTELAESLSLKLADWAQPLFIPRRYKCLWGGRGSGKSYAAADALLIEGLKRKIRVLCAREFQVSIKESVHALLSERINALGLDDFYEAQRDTILGANGSQFIFKGVRHNVQSIKSMAGLTHLWLEEAQTISAESWQVLIPTIREEGSEIWVTFNPLNPTDTVWTELVAKERSNVYVRQVNWNDNPHFPSVLDDERRSLAATDPAAYNHIWEGGFWEKSDAQILNGKWVIEEFVASDRWDGPYHGADWGFGSDPTTAVRCWVHNRKLYVEYESYAYHLELDDTAKRWLEDVPEIDQYSVRADNSRPESISHVKRGRPGENGIPPIPKLVAATKGAGSVEDGIAHLRSYDQIVIHPRCKHTIEEARLYCYKVDRLSGEILPIVVDKFNHCWDAARYALEPVMLSSKIAYSSSFTSKKR